MPREAISIEVVLSLSLVMWHIEALPAPTIQPQPENTVYITGESISLRCAPQALANITGYTFYKDGKVVLEDSPTNILTYSSLTTKDAGLYTCIYFRGDETSPQISFNLRVVDPPSSPLLIVAPQKKIFIKDEDATLRCQLARGQSATGIFIFQDKRLLINTNNLGVLNLTRIQISSSGTYDCNYDVNINNRVVRSSPSSLQTLIVIERPPSPTLLVEPQKNVFITNERVILRCQSPRDQTPSAIHLYQGERYAANADNMGVLTLASIQISDSGNYSCIYDIEKEGETVQSFSSTPQVLFVTDLPPTPQLRYSFKTQNQSTQVELTCQVNNPSLSQIHGYNFYRNGKEIGSNGQFNHFILVYTLDFSGCYSCRTFRRIFEQMILSQMSSEQFLSLDGGDEGQCKEENISYNTIVSHQGLKLFGSVLAGKLLVLLFILIIFGVHLFLIGRRYNLLI